MSWLSLERQRNIDLYMFNKNIKKRLFQQHINNINIAFYNTLPQDVVSYIVGFIPKTVVSNDVIRREVTLFKRNWKYSRAGETPGPPALGDRGLSLGGPGSLAWGTGVSRWGVRGSPPPKN
jgi:hypothetical protein